jgi:diacylglycerol kinase family enzyme
MSSVYHHAVLLNAQAARVDAHVVSRVREMVDPADVFVCRNLQDVPGAITEIVARRYDTVFTAGGDGTVHHFLNSLGNTPYPRVGILRLGTGNALAEMVSSGDGLGDLRGYVTNPSRDVRSLPLCQAEGERFAFGGVGLDATVLRDYKTVRATLGVVSRLPGYIAAAFGLTIPRQVGRWIIGRRTTLRVTNLAAEARRIEVDGQGGTVTHSLGPGTVLYEGPAKACIFGTCPYYGYSLKALPFAGLDPAFFHLRVAALPIARMVVGLGPLWRGTLRHPGLRDFHVERVLVEMSEPFPYQVAGDFRGMRDRLEISLSEKCVDLVRFI